jgi:thiol-disulfide isomerase/thioredoxin
MKYFFLLLITLNINSQTIKGELSNIRSQKVNLIGFDYTKTFKLDSSKTDSFGRFTLTFPKSYRGAGIVVTEDNHSLQLILSNRDIEFKGNILDKADSLNFIDDDENSFYYNYYKSTPIRQSLLSGWLYLMNLYENEYDYKNQNEVLIVIKKEIKRLKNKHSFLNINFNDNFYLKWLLPYRKSLDNATFNAYQNKDLFFSDIESFRKINFNQPNFKTSGIFKELIETHYWLIENSGEEIGTIYHQMNISTDYLLNNIANNKQLLNLVTELLYKYLESRSLFTPASYLSNTLLDKYRNYLDENLINSMEKYYTLRVGNIAPDIFLSNNERLIDIKKNVLLVFGASWCSNCREEALQLLTYYDSWKSSKKIEVIYISIDTDKEVYKNAFRNAPWKMYCDFKGWDSQAVKKFFINSTPSYILLDKNLKIIAHPSSLGQVDAWVKYKL